LGSNAAYLFVRPERMRGGNRNVPIGVKRLGATVALE
jgi:hypothetical protein